MPDLLWLLSALAPLALWVAVRADRRQRDLDARLTERIVDLERFQANLSLGLVEEPRVHLPTPAAEARVRELVAIGHSEANARNLAQVDALAGDEPAVGDEPPEPVTVPVASEKHSRLADVAAFRND